MIAYIANNELKLQINPETTGSEVFTNLDLKKYLISCLIY